jgi:hypothetical protein
MIDIEFLFNNEIVTVKVNGKTLLFGKGVNKGYFAPIDKLQFSKQGVIKEFPDLEDNPKWKDIALERFKEKISNMQTEIEIAKYVVNDLAKFGYKPLRFTKAGSRTKGIKNGAI